MHSPTFIFQCQNAMSDSDCDYLVNMADKIIASNPSQHSSIPDVGNGNRRKDWFLSVNQHNPEAARNINQVLQSCLNQYVEEYMGICYSGRFMSFTQKLQVTPAGGGFHNWHNEHTHHATCDRVLAWMIYLNDLPDGEGETEFLHQRTRINAEKGKCVMFPSGFTHCHRGNPPLTTTKYIVTGWYNLVQDID